MPDARNIRDVLRYETPRPEDRTRRAGPFLVWTIIGCAILSATMFALIPWLARFGLLR